jgi:hypothetical protein
MGVYTDTIPGFLTAGNNASAKQILSLISFEDEKAIEDVASCGCTTEPAVNVVHYLDAWVRRPGTAVAGNWVYLESQRGEL